MVKLKSLIEELLNAHNIKPHQIACRTKSFDSLKKKIERKKDKYSSLEEITDLIGIRIVTYFEDEVDQIASIIDDEFKIDKINSVDKRILATDQFGYRSLHYVIETNNTRNKLIEYKAYKGIKAELQIRSILQHAWAEIEHDIGYKGEFEIPKFAKRRFNRVAALLETADIEFINLKKTLEQYEADLPSRLSISPQDVTIDKASLSEFIENDELVAKIDQKMSERISATISSDTVAIEGIIKRLNYYKITTIQDLQNVLVEKEDQIPSYAYDLVEISKKEGLIDSINNGWSVFILGYLLASQREDDISIHEFLTAVFDRDNSDNQTIAKHLIQLKSKYAPNTG